MSTIKIDAAKIDEEIEKEGEAQRVTFFVDPVVASDFERLTPPKKKSLVAEKLMKAYNLSKEKKK